MHDIRLIRDNPAAFDAALARRGLEPVSAEVLKLDEGRRKLATAAQELQSRRNEASKAIGAAMGRGDKDEAERLKVEVAEIKQSLPEAIDAITRTARAGVPVSNAFALVAPNLAGPLSVEFALIDNWLRLGVPLRQAMQDSAKRIPLNEYRFFAVILIINQEAGGRLGETLDRLSATLRDRHELHLKIQAKTSEARASAKIVASLVPFALGYMYLNSPRDFHFLLGDPTGNMVLFYAFGSVALGLTLTHLMVRRVT